MCCNYGDLMNYGDKLEETISTIRWNQKTLRQDATRDTGFKIKNRSFKVYVERSKSGGESNE